MTRMTAPALLICAALASACSGSELERQIKKPPIHERPVPSYGPEQDRIYWAARARVARRWFPEGMPAAEAVELLKRQGFTVEWLAYPQSATEKWPQSDGTIQAVRGYCAAGRLYCDDVFVELEVSRGRVIWHGRAGSRAFRRETNIFGWG